MYNIDNKYVRVNQATYSSLTCPYCDKNFKNSKQLRPHIKRHENFVQHVCTICNKAFFSKASLDVHKDLHNSYKSFCCETCGKTFGTSTGLYTHLKIHSEDKKYVCSICKKGFHRKIDLTVHLRGHISLTPFKCKTCPAAFRGESHLRRHIRTVHDDISNHQCEICGERFHHAYKLRQHVLVHSAIKECVCNTCGSAFRTKNQLFRHIRRHTGEKPFKCYFCNKSFADASNRKRHLLTHESENLSEQSSEEETVDQLLMFWEKQDSVCITDDKEIICSSDEIKKIPCVKSISNSSQVESKNLQQNSDLSSRIEVDTYYISIETDVFDKDLSKYAQPMMVSDHFDNSQNGINSEFLLETKGTNIGNVTELTIYDSCKELESVNLDYESENFVLVDFVVEDCVKVQSI